MTKKSVFVSVPASSGNLGPGFDVLGVALNLRNDLFVQVVSSKSGAPQIHVVGEGAKTLPRSSSNVVFKTIAFVFKKAKQSVPTLALTCVNRIPTVRGLGSSSAAILSGLLAGNALVGNKFSKDQILDWATAFEGHPDNVAPALLGGARASAVSGEHVVTTLLPVGNFSCVAAIPSFELSTKKARTVVPRQILMKDAVFNLSAVALLPHALKYEPALLKDLLNDRFHEPYRAKLIPGFASVKKAALQAGAHGVILSGAGPTMLAFSPAAKRARVGKAMQKAFAAARVTSTIKYLNVDTKGAVVK